MEGETIVVKGDESIEAILGEENLLVDRVVEEEEVGLVTRVLPNRRPAGVIGRGIRGREIELQVRDLRKVLEHREVRVLGIARTMGSEDFDGDRFLHDLIRILGGSFGKEIVRVVLGCGPAATGEASSDDEQGKR